MRAVQILLPGKATPRQNLSQRTTRAEHRPKHDWLGTCTNGKFSLEVSFVDDGACVSRDGCRLLIPLFLCSNAKSKARGSTSARDPVADEVIQRGLHTLWVKRDASLALESFLFSHILLPPADPPCDSLLKRSHGAGACERHASFNTDPRNGLVAWGLTVAPGILSKLIFWMF